jgi:hypothetical protein
MKFQFSTRHLPILTMLVASTVTLPAAAQERAGEPPLKSRDAKAAEPPAVNLTPATAQERAPESPLKSRDAKTAEPVAPTVDLKIEGIRNGLQIRVLPKEPAPDGDKGTSCKEDCEVKLPAGSYTLIATQVEPEETPEVDTGAPPPPPISESEANRHRLGSALGVGGILAAAMGSYLVIGGLVASDGAPAASPSGLNELFFAGVAGIAVGAGLMIGGFSLAAANRATPVTVGQMPAAVQRRGLAETGVSLSGTF